MLFEKACRVVHTFQRIITATQQYDIVSFSVSDSLIYRMEIIIVAARIRLIVAATIGYSPNKAIAEFLQI